MGCAGRAAPRKTAVRAAHEGSLLTREWRARGAGRGETSPNLPVVRAVRGNVAFALGPRHRGGGNRNGGRVRALSFRNRPELRPGAPLAYRRDAQRVDGGVVADKGALDQCGLPHGSPDFGRGLQSNRLLIRRLRYCNVMTQIWCPPCGKWVDVPHDCPYDMGGGVVRKAGSGND